MIELVLEGLIVKSMTLQSGCLCQNICGVLFCNIPCSGWVTAMSSVKLFEVGE